MSTTHERLGDNPRSLLESPRLYISYELLCSTQDRLGGERQFMRDFLSTHHDINPADSHFEFPSLFLLCSMFPQSTASFLRVTFSPRDTDDDLENARILDYPKQVIYFIVSFIALISLCHFFSLFYHFIFRKRVHEWKRRTTVSLTRLPAAVADSFCALAFRWTVPVGSSHELNFVEVGLTLGYMAVLYTWACVNSMYIHSPY